VKGGSYCRYVSWWKGIKEINKKAEIKRKGERKIIKEGIKE
jgi:hypothetical protein